MVVVSHSLVASDKQTEGARTVTERRLIALVLRNQIYT
jgi:hypothetical protein